MRKHLNIRANIALGLIVAFLINMLGPLPLVRAQEFVLPAPGKMVALSPTYTPVVLKGIKLDPKNPFRFHFFVDTGDASPSLLQRGGQVELKQESSKLIKYFLASLTIPEKDLWVNLSPYEKDRIVPQEFGQTEMGRDLLAQDYLLKQITASVIYPESKLGKEFWAKVYAKAQAKYGTTNIAINTFNKVWIVPEKAVVYENGGTAFVLENHLKVMLEQDYLSLQKHEENMSFPNASVGNLDPRLKHSGVTDFSNLGSQIVREIVIPALTKEVNEGKNFSQLRQVFYSLILATWYKKKIKDSILNKVYSNQNKIQGLLIPANTGIHNKNDVEYIYQHYLQAFKKGVYNYIKEEPNPMNDQTIPRKYFSGGVVGLIPLVTKNRQEVNAAQLADLAQSSIIDIDAKLDLAMIVPKWIKRMHAALNPKIQLDQAKGKKDNAVVHIIKNEEIAENLARRFYLERISGIQITEFITAYQDGNFPETINEQMQRYKKIYSIIKEFRLSMDDDQDIDILTLAAKEAGDGAMLTNFIKSLSKSISVANAEREVKWFLANNVSNLQLEYIADGRDKRLNNQKFTRFYSFLVPQNGRRIIVASLDNGQIEYRYRQAVITQPHEVPIPKGEGVSSIIERIREDIANANKRFHAQVMDTAWVFGSRADGDWTSDIDDADLFLRVTSPKYLNPEVRRQTEIMMHQMLFDREAGYIQNFDIYLYYNPKNDARFLGDPETKYYEPDLASKIKLRLMFKVDGAMNTSQDFDQRFIKADINPVGLLMKGVRITEAIYQDIFTKGIQPNTLHGHNSPMANFHYGKVALSLDEDNEFQNTALYFAAWSPRHREDAVVLILDPEYVKKNREKFIIVGHDLKPWFPRKHLNSIRMLGLSRIENLSEDTYPDEVHAEEGFTIPPNAILGVVTHLNKFDEVNEWNKKFNINTKIYAVKPNDMGHDLYELRTTPAEAVNGKTGESTQLSSQVDRAMKTLEQKKFGPGGIDFNPVQMSMQVKKEGQDFKFDFNGTEIDAAQVTGATFTIRTMTPVTNLPQILGLNNDTVVGKNSPNPSL